MIWHNKFLSIGGRVVLLNSIISNIDIFFLSFYKAPKVIIKDIIMTQISFLLGGDKEANKVCWVSLDVICLPKKEGGLGVKHCGLFIINLLSKWK